jgi:hypothetical protein
LPHLQGVSLIQTHLDSTFLNWAHLWLLIIALILLSYFA